MEVNWCLLFNVTSLDSNKGKSIIWQNMNKINILFDCLRIWLQVISLLGVPFEYMTFWTINRLFSVHFSDHHLNTGPFDNRTSPVFSCLLYLQSLILNDPIVNNASTGLLFSRRACVKTGWACTVRASKLALSISSLIFPYYQGDLTTGSGGQMV